MFHAKLCMPCIGSSIIRRKRVKEKFKFLPDNKFIYLSAPAGYGKATAVTDYLLREKMRYAWFSIDEADNDPVKFWRYLTAAISKCVESSEVEGISIDAKLIGSNISSDLLIHALESINYEFVIVLDDYHLIENKNDHTNN